LGEDQLPEKGIIKKVLASRTQQSVRARGGVLESLVSE